MPKNVWIKFTAKTNAPAPYSIKWQVVNTGEDAINAQQLRGGFESSEEIDSNVRWERTEFKGTHWVEAFVINNEGTCIAKSNQVLVKIR